MEKERKERGRGSSRETRKWREKGKVKSPGWKKKKSPVGLLFKRFQLFLCVHSQGACEKDVDTPKN